MPCGVSLIPLPWPGCLKESSSCRMALAAEKRLILLFNFQHWDICSLYSAPSLDLARLLCTPSRMNSNNIEITVALHPQLPTNSCPLRPTNLQSTQKVYAYILTLQHEKRLLSAGALAATQNAVTKSAILTHRHSAFLAATAGGRTRRCPNNC